jgi:predicted small integral membrane protein
MAQGQRDQPRGRGDDGGEGAEVIALRLAKIAMAASLALFAFMVTFNNITDYDSNFTFVRHVLSMDTTFPNNALRWRAIADPVLWHVGYWVIIFGEALTCAAYVIGTAALLGKLRASGDAFNRGKPFVFIGTALGFLVWFLGFMVVGGEWFATWQSQTWNGQQAAFRFYAALLGAGIFIALEDRDLTT